MNAPTDNTRPSPRDLAADPALVLDLARMLRMIASTIYDAYACPTVPVGYADADLWPEMLTVEGVLRGWSVEETHGAMIERARSLSGDTNIRLVPYREMEEEDRKHTALMRHCAEFAVRAIVKGNGDGWKRESEQREAWRARRPAAG